jgi:gluconokinase
MRYDNKLGVVECRGKAYSDAVNLNGNHEIRGLFGELMEIGRQVAESHDISAVAVVGTWHSMVLCDEKIEPVTPCYTWTSTLGNDITRLIRKDEKLVNELYTSTGCMVNTTYPLYKLVHLYRNNFNLSKCRILGENDYIFYRLTGEIATSKSAASGSGFLNIHELKWNDLSASISGIKKSQLPPLFDYDMSAPLKEDMAALLNIEPGIPVTVSQADGAMNQLGAGALVPGRMTLSVGTSAAARMIRNKPSLQVPEGTWCYYAPSSWLGGVATAGASSCLDWFMKHFAGETGYKELEDNLVIKKDGPFFMPFLFGERCPGWNDNRNGGFLGLNGGHDKRDLYAALLEGILYNLYHSYQYLVKACGIPEKIFLSGGIVNSKVWMQMIADIWQRCFTVKDFSQASMLGGAAIAMHILGHIGDIVKFNLNGNEVEIIRPRPEMAEFYADRFEKYKKLYYNEVDLSMPEAT